MSSEGMRAIVREAARFSDDSVSTGYLCSEARIRFGRELSLGEAREMIDRVRRAGPQDAPRPPGVVRLSDVEPEPVEWVWPGRIARGKLNGLAGDPGLGKTTVALDVGARITRGLAMPDGSPGGPPADVLVLTAEDGLADTIRPRMEAAGADLTRVLAPAPGDAFTFPDDTGRLALLALEHKIALIIVDPLAAFLDGSVNSWKNADVRRALAPLKDFAEATGAALLVIEHLSKAEGKAAIYRVGGSIGLVAAMRMASVVASDPDDEGRRILASLKNNLSRPAPSLSFTLRDAGGVAAVEWGGETPVSAAAALAARAGAEERTELDEAKDFLRVALVGDRRPARDVGSQARAAGISDRTLKRARAALKEAGELEVEREGFGAAGVWYLRLTGAPKESYNEERPSMGGRAANGHAREQLSLSGPSRPSISDEIPGRPSMATAGAVEPIRRVL
jgi:hypothetical protein